MGLQAEDHLPAEGELVAEGEIIRSSVCCEFGGSCISHAAGSGISSCAGWTGGVDEQPLTASVNSALQQLVLIAFMGQFLGSLAVDGVTLSEQLATEAGRLAQAVPFVLRLVTLTPGVVALASGLIDLVGQPVEGDPQQQAGH